MTTEPRLPDPEDVPDDWPEGWRDLPAEVLAVLCLGAEIGDYSMRRRLGPLLDTPLTLQQLRGLTFLVIEESMTPQHLSELLEVSPATITGLVDRLVRAGMVDRTADSRDGRGRVLTPTRAGIRVVRRLMASDVETDAAVLQALRPAELTALHEGLSGVLRALRTQDDEP
ncbi:MarR family winged helix-turn-helix transcriptional regulator [Modestobacter sp. VKM Ac-2984]|uniref:MarR family winged helix-turn-helix transcriptional regulator n=1 Tax=Modestobacter sp. VKM Ac-2984 TaxID=3004138 RepID=UPI0022AAA5AD|nr:MarR family transcriptional regulator [Modestobacter sp. VKM Ac-2984]MCZ2818678.1 MarR family transcriptional regulator [Modestobacter sp. VKM Ac-2984]